MPITDEVAGIRVRHDFSTFLFNDCNHHVSVRSLLARPFYGCPLQHSDNAIELLINLSPDAECPFDLMCSATQHVGFPVHGSSFFSALKLRSYTCNHFHSSTVLKLCCCAQSPNSFKGSQGAEALQGTISTVAPRESKRGGSSTRWLKV